MIYRRANKNDIPAVSKFLATLYEMSYEEVVEENKEFFEDDTQAFFLALDGEMPIGAAQGSIRTEYVNGTNGGKVGYLEAIFVSSEYRRRGVATGLVKLVEEWARENECEEMASDCLLDNVDSYNFHTRIGFAETERCIFFKKDL